MNGNLMKSGILAGLVVGIASVLYCTMENKVAAAILFSFALFYVCLLNLDLFTGRIGFAFSLGKSPLWFVWVLVLNIVGAVLCGLLASFCLPAAVAGAESIMAAKLSLPLLSLLVKGAFCGVMMSLAVLCFKRETGFVRYIGVFLCIPIFILAGFEHSIADACYMALAGAWDFLVPLAFVVAGNTLGSLFLVWLEDRS